MRLKTLLVVSLAVICSLTVEAQRKRGGARGADGGEIKAKGNYAKVQIVQMPKIGAQSLIPAPVFNAQMQGGAQPIVKKIRRWGVFELQYATYVKWQEELSFTWHVLCDTSKAKEKDRSKDAAPLPAYVYYTTTVRYINIPDGNHMACTCLPPSAIDRYGEPVAITVLITNKDGDELALDGFGNVKGVDVKSKWWEDDRVMGAVDKKGKQLVELRAGLLLDRSKTPFALINSADYEVIQ